MVVGYDPSGATGGTSVLMTIVAGGVSASVSRGLINPFDVLKIRIQLLPRDINYGIPDMIRTMVKREGLTVFWKGHIPAQLMSISHGVAQFTTYELLSKWTGAFEPHSSYLPAIDFACGCFAGAAGTICSNPADVVRTRVVGFPGVRYNGLLPTALEIYRNEGMQAFFRGTVPGVLSRAPLAGLQFTFYRLFIDLYQLLTGALDEIPSHSTCLFSGALSGLCGECVVYPMDTIRKNLMMSNERFDSRSSVCASVRSCAQTIFARGGVLSFYRGFSVAALKSGFSMAFQFTMIFYHCFIRMDCMNESGSSAFAGACSGCLSKAVLYPLELIRRMLQVQGSSVVASVPSGSFYICAGFWHCTKIIFRKEGVSGYYKGFILSAIKSIFSTTLNFFCYEFMLSTMHARNRVAQNLEMENSSKNGL